MNRYVRETRWGLLAVAGLLIALVSVQPGSAADQAAKKKKKKAKDQAETVVSTADPAPKIQQHPVRDLNSLTARIDAAVQARLAAENVPASPQADDGEFLRRTSLDITGVIPTAEQARAFLDSRDPNKRAKLIDELLASPNFGRHMADTWQELLLTRTSDNRRLQPAPFVKWLAENFNANTPWNEFVHQMLTASGSQDKHPGVTYFLANGTVDKITDNVCKNLLGIQLQCAQCHNHPFTGWKQTEYWGMAAFFMKVRPDNVNKAAKNGNSPGITEVATRGRGKQRLPVSAKIVPAKFLQGAEPKMNSSAPFRPVLADWATSQKNPYFAKAMVNRVWAGLFGRGLVNPVDDMHDNNPASHPELLRELTAGFAQGGFDVKGLIRAICNSQTYQRTSKPVKGNEDAEASLYSRMPIKVLSPEELYDSLIQTAGAQTKARPARGKNGRGRATPRDQFVAFFQAAEGADPTEYNSGIPQALRLMNSNQFNTNGMVATAVRSGKKAEEVVEQFYLATLSRRPTTAESARCLAHLKKTDARTGYGDVLWALLNSSEFGLNH
jgi:Protein of unknown function (DUF1549)/Protein of unknown function (DUF1553)